jgi:hypothetical protein
MIRRRPLFTLSAPLAILAFLATLAALTLFSPAMAGEQQGVDWTRMVATATGVGSAPEKAQGTPEARKMAERAALLDARRNLLEVVGGVYIDSETRVADFMALSDVVAARVKGMLRNSTASASRTLPDGSVEVTVSMPLTGEFSKALLETDPKSATPDIRELEQRVQRLEKQVQQLVEQLGRSNQVNSEQRIMLDVLTRLVAAWGKWLESEKSMLLPAASSADNRRLAQLEKAVREQAQKQARLAARLSARIEDLSTRLAHFEGRASTSAMAPTAERTQKPSEAGEVGGSEAGGNEAGYTGLVVDATGLGFLAALQPKLYGKGVQLYPGEKIRLLTAAKDGYARYYRNVSLAQQSSRVGSLPLTVRAEGLHMGDKRSLELRERDVKLVRAILETPGNFLDRCRVVIVF